MTSQPETISQLLAKLYDLDNRLGIIENRFEGSPQLWNELRQALINWASSPLYAKGTQLERRIVSTEQLIVEAQTTFDMIEKKEEECTNAIQSINYNSTQQLIDKQWNVLVALHLALLGQYHEMFFIIRHPSATLELRKFITEHRMLERMWQRGIFSFLKLLKQKLPESLEHMRTFYYTANNISSDLIELMPSFKRVWEEYLKAMENIAGKAIKD